VIGVIAAGVVLGAPMLTAAGTLCVNPSGSGGCYSTIGAAVTAASPNDTVMVAGGTYHENVVISKPLSLVAGAGHVVIDASGLPNGVDIDGYHNPGLSHVTVTGFTVVNANFQGILVTNASDITIVDNHVTENDRRLDVGPPPTCPGLPPYFQAGEGFDCGEGIHLSGVSHSTVASNLVERNAGGILLSDDTGATHDNLISGNVVTRNPFDCGITLAGHHFALMPNSPGYGVFHNTIAGNTASHNGLSTGEGAGVGIFAGPPGAMDYGNVVIGNTLIGNALPGVTMHSHSPFQNLNDNLITGNRISRNGPDGDAPTTAPTGIVVFSDTSGGAPPITGTVISQNVIQNEDIDIAVATDGSVDAHLNTLLGRPIGVQNLGTATVDARQNWWGCAKGPSAPGCAHVDGPNVLVSPWLTKPLSHDGDPFDEK
jgi:parallel beta-helix repeat protein